MEYYNPTHDQRDHHPVSADDRHDDAEEDIVHRHRGEDSNEEFGLCDDVQIMAKIEKQDPFLFFMQPVPQQNECSAIILRTNEYSEYMEQYFETAGAYSSSDDELGKSEEDEFRTPIYGFPFPLSETSRLSNTELWDCLSGRFLHIVRCASLLIRQCWMKRYTKSTKCTVNYRTPIYAILGQTLSMCHRDVSAMLDHFKEGYAQDCLLNMIS